MTDLQAELRAFLPNCMEQRNGRFYPTESGCRRLMEWLAERGINAKVSIDDNKQFAISYETEGGSGDG